MNIMTKFCREHLQTSGSTGECLQSLNALISKMFDPEILDKFLAPYIISKHIFSILNCIHIQYLEGPIFATGREGVRLLYFLS